jgi:hypothetical protein
MPVHPVIFDSPTYKAEIKYRYSLWMKHTKVKKENKDIPWVAFYYDNRLPIEMYVVA